MPLITLSITAKQTRARHQRITRGGRGSLPHEIRMAINEYVAGPRQVEAAFMKLLIHKGAQEPQCAPASCEDKRKTLDRNLACLRKRPMLATAANTSAEGLPKRKRLTSKPQKKDVDEAYFRNALSKINRQYKETFKKLAE